MDHGRPFDLTGLIIRWMMAMFLVFATYNPSGRSYYHWVVEGSDDRWILKAAVGMFLLFCFWAGIDITRRSLHSIGLSIVSLFATFAAWWVVDLGYVDIENATEMTLLVMTTFASVIAIGLSYSHVHYRISGVKQIEET